MNNFLYQFSETEIIINDISIERYYSKYRFLRKGLITKITVVPLANLYFILRASAVRHH